MEKKSKLIRDWLDENIPAEARSELGAKGAFIQVPEVFIRCPHIPPGAKLVYMAILWHRGQKASCFPAQKTLAKDIGRDSVNGRAQVNRHIKLLVESGLIKKISQKGHANTYSPYLIVKNARIKYRHMV